MPNGSCLCQKVKYEYTGEPLVTAICHCLTCKKVAGSTNTYNMLVPKENFHVTAGSPKQYDATHESGMALSIHFCDTCGTPLYKTADRESFLGKVIVQAGTLDDASMLDHAKPGMELYVKHRVGWLSELGEVQQNQEFGAH